LKLGQTKNDQSEKSYYVEHNQNANSSSNNSVPSKVRRSKLGTSRALVQCYKIVELHI